MRGKVCLALLLGLVVGVAALGNIKPVIPKVSYEVVPGASGYLILVIPNTYGLLLNRFGIALRVEGEVTGALALGGTGPASIDGGPFYWVISLPGKGLAPRGILLVSVKVPEGTDVSVVVSKIWGFN